MPDEWPNKGDTIATIGLVEATTAMACHDGGHTKSVFTRDVEAYTIVGGNRLKKPFAFLMHLSFRNFWDSMWDWEIEKISLKPICGADINVCVAL